MREKKKKLSQEGSLGVQKMEQCKHGTFVINRGGLQFWSH